MEIEKEKLCKKDNDFLASLGMVSGSIRPGNIGKRELFGILREDKDFQKEFREFFLG